MKAAILAMGLFAIGLTAKAQTQAQATAHAPDGGTREMIQNISIPPLMNASFSAVVTTEVISMLADGTTATVWNRRTVARDSTGRIFQQRVFFGPNGNTEPPRIRALQYMDPNRHEVYDCIVAQKTCYISKYARPAMAEMPAGMGGLQVCGCASPQRGGVTITHDALGQKTIEDADTTGSREVTTLPVGQIGNQKPQPIVKEFWYSPRLGLNLITKRFDPRSGTENFTVENLSLNEPDPKMFEPPADYQVVRQVVERPGIPQTAH